MIQSHLPGEANATPISGWHKWHVKLLSITLCMLLSDNHSVPHHVWGSKSHTHQWMTYVTCCYHFAHVVIIQSHRSREAKATPSDRCEYDVAESINLQMCCSEQNGVERTHNGIAPWGLHLRVRDTIVDYWPSRVTQGGYKKIKENQMFHNDRHDIEGYIMNMFLGFKNCCHDRWGHPIVFNLGESPAFSI